jgi:GDPmannose 4,6-dehydratase|tara:strand:+ start:34 stop:1071 length:1038 start_codon:yes stop_codon:yes gene_type:complete
MTKKALITGITGQDGSYLSRLLIEKGYEVHGTVRRSSTINTYRIDDLISKHSDTGKLKLHYSDLLDSSSLNTLVQTVLPDEIYNLAAQSHVMVSFQNPMFTAQTGTIGSLSLLEAIRHSEKDIKFYQASSSEMYGGKLREPLNEDSIFDPRSPYAVSKVFAHNMTKMYRDSYDLFCVNGILFNHESPLRGQTFVTRKISRALGRIHLGIQEKLTLGNLDASRDWGYAGDYVKGMWKMLQHNEPDDWVLATGETHTVKDFLQTAFSLLNLDWKDYILTSDKYLRPNEVEYLLGDYSKAKEHLDWTPETSFKELVEKMINADIELAKRDKVLLNEGLIEPTWEYPIF